MAALLRNPSNPRIHMERSLVVLRSFSLSSATAAEEKSKSSSSSSMSTYRQLKSSIKSESDPDKLAEIFLKSSDHPRFFRDRSAFDLTVQKLSRSRRSDLIQRILEHQKHTPLPKYEGFWIRLMMLYSNSRMFDQAIHIFDEMENDLGCQRTEKSLSALLTVCLENHRYDLVHKYIKSVPSKIGVSPTLVSYNLVMRAFCEEKKIESARSLLDKMQNEMGLKPGVTSYNILLGAYLRDGMDNKFDEILKQVSNKGLEPNLVTYNLRIVRLCRSKECARANKLIDEMVSEGIKPNLTSFNSLIDGFSKIADFESAKKVLEIMRNDYCVHPNCDSYITLIRHLVQEGEFESALEMCKQSIKRNWIPPFASMEALVNGLVKNSKVDEAREVVEKMKKRLRGKAVDSWTKVEALLPL